MSSSSSSPFDALTTTTATKAAPTSNTEAPAKDGSEVAADGTAGGNGIFHERQKEEVEEVALLLLINITQQTSITTICIRQIKINLIIKQSNVISK